MTTDRASSTLLSTPEDFSQAMEVRVLLQTIERPYRDPMGRVDLGQMADQREVYARWRWFRERLRKLEGTAMNYDAPTAR